METLKDLATTALNFPWFQDESTESQRKADQQETNAPILKIHPGISAELLEMVNADEASVDSSPKDKGIFIYKNASEWLDEARQTPIPKMLFDEFWVEGEICFLFADTNLGKSILAVQIAESIASGTAVQGFKLEAEKQKVLLYDFELTAKQFEGRYSTKNTDLGVLENHYPFSNNLLRCEFDPENIPDEDIDKCVINSMEKNIVDTGSKVLIIDNITYLKNETEKAKDALPLMKQLKALKKKHGLSILALAHTPKRDLSKPLTVNDLQGSKMLMNFTDSCFAIGHSYKDSSLRYIKQIKVRYTEKRYDAENVIVCEIAKPDNFLRFEFLDFSTEREHLKEVSEKDIDELEQKVLELKNANPNLTLREIANQVNSNHMKVKRILKKHGVTL